MRLFNKHIAFEIALIFLNFVSGFWAQQDHPNIIKLHEIWEWNDVCFLVLE